MTEPSYYPLSPLKSRLEDASSPYTGQPSEEGADPLRPRCDSVGNLPGSHSSMFHVPLRPQRSQKRLLTHRLPPWRTMQTAVGMALLPLFAIGYLAFCYTVHDRPVPVNTYGLYSVEPEHLATIKGGITSISVIVISIALLPIYDIISSLKSEEFFRVLASRSQGVPLETINYISNPSFGNTDAMIAMRKNRCSNYYIFGIVASLLTWIVGTLAPGVLTINSVLADGDLVAIAVGAVTQQSVLNGTNSAEPAFNSSLNAGTAASITWAEMELGVQYSFGVANTSETEYAAFIVPAPLDLSTSTTARWLSDVIGINPTCSWAATNITSTVQLPYNSTNAFDQNFATAHLVDLNLDVRLNSGVIPLGNPFFASVQDPTIYVTNHTTQAIPSDGSTVFVLGQCISGCSPSTPVDLTLDLSSVSTTLTIALTDQTWSMAILTCLPNITIETREVRNEGQGILSVQPLGGDSKLTRQGNLNAIQTTALFSIATMYLQDAGQLTGSRVEYSSLGSQVQGDVLFGQAQFEGLPGIGATTGTLATISPVSIENITQGYSRIIQSSAKPFLASYLGTAYVPGRISNSEFVFAASIPNLAVSTAVFALLAAVLIIAQLRSSKGTEFTLVNVAAAMHNSELPAHFAQGLLDADAEVDSEVYLASDKGIQHLGGKRPGESQDIAEVWGERYIYMQRRVDGSPILHIS
ncbi:hypothetical protein JVU11DRAFT_1158 [Chiua virens]|nr:hypothetical protein JVU11DRAFT_1158 [Chiua virens]